MTQCNTIRSFITLLFIKLAVESQVNAFNIYREEDTTLSSKPDLSGAESIISPRDDEVKVIDITNNTEQIVNTEKTYNNVNAATTVETTINPTKTITIRKTKQELGINETEDTVGTTVAAELEKYNVYIALTAATEANEDDRTTTQELGSTTIDQESTPSTNTPDNETTIFENISTTTNTEIETTNYENLRSGFIQNGASKIEISNTKNSDKTLDDNQTTSVSYGNIPKDTTIVSDKTTEWATELNDASHIDAITTDDISKVSTNETPTRRVDDETNEETSSTSNSLTTVRMTYTVVDKAKVEITTDQNIISSNPEVIPRSSSGSLIPYWKKYKEIDRKRVTNKQKADSKSADSLEMLVNAESGQVPPTIFPSLEKAFSKSSHIPSVSGVDGDELSITDKLTTDAAENQSTDYSSKPSLSVTTQTDDSPSTTLQITSDSPKLGVISSLRAGFLDYSSKPTTESEASTFDEQPSTTQKEVSVLMLSEKEMAPETSTSELQTADISNSTTNMLEVAEDEIAKVLQDGAFMKENTEAVKKGNTPSMQLDNDMASKSQLAEDAVKEELMKEEILSNIDENSKRYSSDIVDVKALEKIEKTLNSAVKTGEAKDTFNLSEDKLSVKPIYNDKKNNSKYAVNPNYKPLKKLDVQPAKPFMRDPDDNSWRNESLSTLGIVFKGKNASKAFTQVIKNKTEMKLNSLTEAKSEEQSPELRTRLEKIAELRKSKKKKIDNYGNTYYTDYEENVSNEKTTTDSSEFGETLPPFVAGRTIQWPVKMNTAPPETVKFNVSGLDLAQNQPGNIFKSGKHMNSNVEDYDVEEDEVDYMHEIDIKKSKVKTSSANPSKNNYPQLTTNPTKQQFPERKPTIQYFPPKEKAKVVLNEYDDNFRSKIKEYSFKPEKLETVRPETMTTTVPITHVTWKQAPQRNSNIWYTHKLDTDIIKDNYALPPSDNQYTGYTESTTGGAYNRPSYVIKHLKDFINEVAKNDDADTDAPLVGVTTAPNTGGKRVKVKAPAEYYEYEAQFRKDVLNKFIENFNQHSERFKVDFPILYNTSIVHSRLPDEGVASSSAFMKRLYEDAQALRSEAGKKRFDPNCDKTIELSPAYELHYYIPEEEEKEIQDPRAMDAVNSAPYVFRL